VAPENMKVMLENIPIVVTGEDNNDLMNPIKEVETQNAIWILEPDKALGLDYFYIPFHRLF
jgi:hypothetical protein